MGERIDTTEARRRINAAMHASGRDAQELLPAAREALSALTAEVEALRAKVAWVEALRDELREVALDAGDEARDPTRRTSIQRTAALHAEEQSLSHAADRITEALEARR